MTTCDKCQFEIEDHEVCVNYSETVETPEKKTLIDKHFHQKCWIEQYNKSLDVKIKAYTNQVMEGVKPFLAQLQGGVC